MQAVVGNPAATLLLRAAVARFTVDLAPKRRRRLFITLSIINVALAATTALFIMAWTHLADYSPAAQSFIKHVLVQGHLATENVLAAWYSSMMLLAVAAGAFLAFAADTRETRSPFRWGWVLVGFVFVALSLDEIGSYHERIGMVTALSPSGDRAVGWVWVFAVPIVVVATFLLGFAWLHVRRAPGAFWWMAAGVLLFAADPLFEMAEMALFHGAPVGTPERRLHDILVVLEEGGLELFGILCFLMGILAYVRFSAGERSDWSIPDRSLQTAARVLTALLAIGVFAATKVVRALPDGDTGTPANWFPAAMFFLVALGALSCRDRDAFRRRLWAVFALAVSGYCGAGFYAYSKLLQYGQPHVAMLVTVIGGWMLEGTLTGVPSTVEPNPSSDRPGR